MSAVVAATSTKTAPASATTFVLQRKCACGNNASESAGECTECQRRSALGLQKKRAISSADDPLEHEADRAAHHVMSMPAQASLHAGNGLGSSLNQTSVRPPVLSRVPSGAGAGPSDIPSSVHRVLQSSGEAIPDPLRSYFEPRFGHDFSNVRIHRHALAAESAHAVSARAYTVGNNIAFAAGAYSPDTYNGRTLIAHELAHVIQQGHGVQRVQRQPEGVGTETSGGAGQTRVDQGALETAFAAIRRAALVVPGLAPLAAAYDVIRAIIYFWEHREQMQAQLLAAIERTVQTIPQLAQAKMNEVLARLGGTAGEAISCVWDQMFTMLESLAQHWREVLTSFIEDMFGAVFVRAIPVIITNVGGLIDDVTSGEFRRAIDRGVTIMTEINSIVGVLFLWFAIFTTVVGGAAGSEVPAAGNAVGAAAGTTVAQVVNIALLTSVLATETVRIGRGIDEMVQFWDDPRRDAGCRQVAEGVFALAFTAALFFLGPGIQRVARNIISRAAQAVRAGAGALRQGAGALEGLTPRLAPAGPGGAMPFSGLPPVEPAPQLRGPRPGTTRRPGTTQRPPPTIAPETGPKPGATPAEAPGPAPGARPDPRVGAAPAGEDPGRRADRCIDLFNLPPNQQARWHQQRAPINGHTTVLSAAFRLDAGFPPPPGQVTTGPSRLWARGIGLPTDDAGHVIGRRFGGTAIYNAPDGNIFPQNLTVNRGRMVVRDREAATLHGQGCDVCVHIRLNYDNASALRPNELVHTIMSRPPGAADFGAPGAQTLPNP